MKRRRVRQPKIFKVETRKIPPNLGEPIPPATSILVAAFTKDDAMKRARVRLNEVAVSVKSLGYSLHIYDWEEKP